MSESSEISIGASVSTPCGPSSVSRPSSDSKSVSGNVRADGSSSISLSLISMISPSVSAQDVASCSPSTGSSTPEGTATRGASERRGSNSFDEVSFWATPVNDDEAAVGSEGLPARMVLSGLRGLLLDEAEGSSFVVSFSRSESLVSG